MQLPALPAHLLILPDIGLIVLTMLVLAADLTMPVRWRRQAVTLLAGLGLLTLVLVLWLLPYDVDRIFVGGFRVTGFALLWKQVLVLSALCTVLLARPYFVAGGTRRRLMGNHGEFHALILVCTLGMCVVVSAVDLLTLFVGMEMATIPMYVLSAYLKGDDLSAEAATKFIIMGSLSTGLMLFGYSFLYGAAGSLHFQQILAAAQANPDAPLLMLGIFFVLAGIGFKLTLVPFHMWAPDVYEGAPTPVTALLAISSKATGAVFLALLLYGPLAPLHATLKPVLLLLAAITMTVGNLGALQQKNLRRFMAYSSISQAGYILLALTGERHLALTALVFYFLVYAAANYTVFFIISIVGQKQDENFSALRGLGANHPVLAATLMLAAFSLAGMPPLAGFLGKFLLFAAAAQQGYYLMVAFAALNSTISLYYYLLLLKEAYIVAPESQPPVLSLDLVQKVSLAVLTLGMILPACLPRMVEAISVVCGR